MICKPSSIQNAVTNFVVALANCKCYFLGFDEPQNSSMIACCFAHIFPRSTSANSHFNFW